MPLPLYGFMEGDPMGLLIVADEQESVRSLAGKLQDAASLRVDGRCSMEVVYRGIVLDPDITVAQADFKPLQRFDLRRSDGFRKVASLDELWEGEMMTLEVDGQVVLLINVDGGIHAYADSCPHLRTRLSQGRLEHNLPTCATHGWEFDAGSCTTGLRAHQRDPGGDSGFEQRSNRRRSQSLSSGTCAPNLHCHSGEY